MSIFLPALKRRGFQSPDYSRETVLMALRVANCLNKWSNLLPTGHTTPVAKLPFGRFQPAEH